MKLLTARRSGTNFRYRVHLDETKTVPDPATGDPVPDPEYVIDRTWGADPRAPGETAPAYTARLTAFEAQARREMRLTCVALLAALTEQPTETVLAGEGAAF